ncbi:MAG: HNH endonuclease [Planctomycetaceae bacterium]|nr:HNH endonuclease [Planctomycetaceae bacterium]
MDLRRRVAERAGHCCEYCRIPQAWTSVPFQLDHVIAEKHEGETSFANLAYACLHCNSFKAPNIAGHDADTGEIVRLFNPRHDNWSDHFEWNGALVMARTAIGRVTVAVLRINLPYRVAVRASLIEEGLLRRF